jgi:hypothetical protein
MRPLFSRALACLGGAALALGAAGLNPVDASGGANLTCSGGSIPGGSYGTLTITGECLVDSGSISATSVSVAPGGWLIAAFGSADGSTDNVTTTSITVGLGSVLVLGCEPAAFACLNDPNANTSPTYYDTFSLSGSLTSVGASAVIVHNGTISDNVGITGGGGGKACNFGTGPLMGNPFYDDLEDNTIGGNVTVQGVNTCWLGLFRNSISHNVTFNHNTDPNSTAFVYPFPPDGNEIATNWIGGNLACQANYPTPQFGDSGGSPNTVIGYVRGQCTAVVY